jgi:hypothetical protein
MARDFSVVEKEYNSAKTRFDRFKVSPNRDGSYTVSNRRYSATEFNRLRRDAEAEFKKIEKEYKAVSAPRAEKRNELKALEKQVKDLSERFVAGQRSKQGRRITQADIDSVNNRITVLRKEVGDKSSPSPMPMSADAAERLIMGTSGSAGPTGPTDSTATGTGGSGAGGAGGGGSGAGAGGGRTPKPKLPKNWEAKFREMFPAQSWLLDLDKTKYPKLNKLIQQGIINRSWETPEAQARFAAELQNTDFFVELKQKDTVRTIKSLVGDLGFDSIPFNKFLTTAANFGWEGENLKAEVYKEAFRKDDDGNYVNPTAFTRAQASTDYKKAQAFGRAFFSNISESTIEQRLTGVITDEDLIRQQRELAKTRYSHLGNLIDQGLTLEDIAGSFQRQAAQILERDVNAIDMGSADFETAFNFGEEGKKRMMSSGEWEILLRSDKKYGWDKTENAKREARNLASSIAQAFGRVI